MYIFLELSYAPQSPQHHPEHAARAVTNVETNPYIGVIRDTLVPPPPVRGPRGAPAGARWQAPCQGNPFASAKAAEAQVRPLVTLSAVAVHPSCPLEVPQPREATGQPKVLERKVVRRRVRRRKGVIWVAPGAGEPRMAACRCGGRRNDLCGVGGRVGVLSASNHPSELLRAASPCATAPAHPLAPFSRFHPWAVG